MTARSLVPALHLAGVFLVACAGSPDDGAVASAPAMLDAARVVEVSLDAPTSWLVDHTESVTFAVRYAGGSLSSSVLFPRSDLAQGIATKSVTVRTDAAIEACSFTWIVTERPHGAPAGSTRALLKPTGFNGVYTGACVIGATAVALRLPWEMSTVAIDLSAEAFDAHAAKGVLGQMTVEGTLPKFALGYSVASATWSVDVLAPPGAKRTASLTWVLRAGGTVQSTVETTSDRLTIE